MKRYHPHGDQSIYPTLVRLAQDWNMRHRLVHPQGNFGSIAGLPPAAHRYTEARLSAVGAELLADLDHDTVDYADSYDGKYREPLVLPSRFPNLLVNGSDGIAVGMATDIPPHNLNEVCDALVRLIDNPAISVVDLMADVPDPDDPDNLLYKGLEGPDFPTGGIICGRQGILDGYAHGRGKITLRARAEIVEDRNRSQIVISEVPYQQTRNRLAEAIGELVKDERIKGVSEIRDESSQRNGEPVRLVVYLKRDADPNLVLNQLYEFSPLQQTVSIILLAIVDGRPRKMTLKEMLEVFLRHRVQVIRRRTEHLLREAKRRSHVLEGQLIAVSSLDEVIRTCREAASRDEAKVRLQQLPVAAAVLGRALGADHFAALQREIGVADTYRMTEAQAEAVVRMQLGQLARLQRDEILKEYHELRAKIAGYEKLLSSERNILDEVKADLTDLKERYGRQREAQRRTQITGEVGRIDMADLIPEETQAVTLSHRGYLKRMPLGEYRTQHRGGRGVSGGGPRDDDFVEHLFVASTHAWLLCVTDRGQLYWLKVYDIPEQKRTGTGRSIANVLSLREGEKVSAVIAVRDFAGEFGLLMATQRGVVKKTLLAEYSRPRQGGIIGIALDEGDRLIGAALVRPGDEVLLCTKRGMSLRFDEADARAMGRNTRGVRGIKLGTDDEVVGMVVTEPGGYLLTVCANGYGKRTPFGANTQGVAAEDEADAADEAAEPAAEGEEGEEAAAGDNSARRYRKQRRGGKGIRDVRTSERNGPVVGVAAVHDSDDIMLITAGGMVNRTHVSEVRITGRNTQGVRLMNLKEGDRIASLAKVAPEEEGEAPAAAAPDGPSETPAP
jgi:DNA gyrase subunit A